MQRDYFWPSALTDRQQPAVWEEDGGKDMWQRANIKVREILKDHRPVYVEPDIDDKIRRHYKILLD